MGILEETIKELKVSDLDQQVRELCDIIAQEERGGKKYDGPDGPNTFLSLFISKEQRGRGKNIVYQEIFLTLEREQPETYILGVWERYVKEASDHIGPLKRITVIEVKENKAEKILKKYAEQIQFLKGK